MSNKNYPRYTMSMYMNIENILKAIHKDATEAVNDVDDIDIEYIRHLKKCWLGAGGKEEDFPKARGVDNVV